MKRLSVFTVLLFAIAAIAVPVAFVASGPGSVDTESVGISSDRLDRVRESLLAEVEARHVGSAVGLIARSGQIVFLEAVGEASPGVPMPTDAIVRLASSAKTFTAAATMILYEEGRLRLDDPLERYIPEFANLRVANPQASPGEPELVEPERSVTIRDLLTHTSGLDVASDAFEEAWMATEGKTTTRDLAKRMAKLPMVAQPGTTWEYGYYGSSYEVLAAVLEEASDMTLEELLEDRIFDPLGMQDTYFFVPEEKEHRLAAMYQMRGGQLSIARPARTESERNTFFSGGGGERSTVLDFYRFCQMLLNGGELEGTRVLSPKSVQLMMSDQLGPELQIFGDREYGWGFGALARREVRSGDIGTVGTYGWNGGTGTAYWIDPTEELIGIVFAPYWPPAHYELRKKFEVGMYQALTESRVRP